MKTYQSFYKQSIEHPETFWKEQAQAIDWYRSPEQILSYGEDGYPKWFADGSLNMSYLCIDRHIEDGYGEEIALIYDSPVTNQKRKITYNELKAEVAKLAGGLRKLGLQKGDCVLIYMPMIPQAAFSMLACARLGVIHTVVFGGFAPSELALRIDDCKPKAILTASSGIEVDKIIPYKPFVDKAIELALHKPQYVILHKRLLGALVPDKEYDIDYKSLIAVAEEADPVPVAADHPLYVLHTSGTTGKPKGIVRDTGGYATALKFSMNYIYGVQPGEVFWAASDVGWVVGHSFIIYGPLLNRNKSILFEGKPIKTPDASTFWRIISEYGVVSMFTAPTAIRAIRKEDSKAEMLKEYDLSSLRYLFLAGERSDQATMDWLKNNLGSSVIDHWWQTESGWPMVANMVGIEELPGKPGSVSVPVCGYDIRILDENGNETQPGTEGFVVAKLPLPPGTLAGIWNHPERFRSGYLKSFEGYYFTGDGGYKDPEGFVFITGRVDDVINVAGHRLSTADMEEIIAAHEAVAECAVFGIQDSLKGQIPLALIVTKDTHQLAETILQEEIVQKVRNHIGAIASLKRVIVVKRLPKTRSGKILRKLLRDIADQKAYSIPSTIDDAEIINEIKAVYQQHRI